MNNQDLNLIENMYILKARSDFYYFRMYMHPNLIKGWYQTDLCDHLMQWYQDYKDGKAPRLIINTPPQHGKSTTIGDFIAWLLGKENGITADTCKVIYTSYSERLAIRANLALQRITSTSKYKKVFPNLILPDKGNRERERSRTFLEFKDTESSFRNTTIQGSITGESLDVGIIDDPIKSRKEANSITTREATWEWLTDDFLTRFSKKGALIAIATRWHVDDPIGRLIDADPTIKVVKYKAIAEQDEKYRKKGEPLFKQHKDLKFLEKVRSVLASESWFSLYQQEPIVQGGNLIKVNYFKRYKQLPRLEYIRFFVDCASKIKEENDYTAIGVYGLGLDGHLYIIEIKRFKLEFTPMLFSIVDLWNKYKNFVIDGYNIPLRNMTIEDKSSGIQLIQELKLKYVIPIQSIQRQTDKYTRFLNVQGYIENGYIHLPAEAQWCDDFINECSQFTGKGDTHDDQVDTLIDACDFILNSNNNSLGLWNRLA